MNVLEEFIDELERDLKEDRRKGDSRPYHR